MRLYSILTFSLFSVFQLFAQDPSQTLEKQFEQMYTTSSNYKEYKVVKKAAMLQFKQNALDSLQQQWNEIAALQNNTNKQLQQIQKLQDELNDLRATLNETIESKDSFSFLGVSLKKTTYSLITWGLIILLTFAFLVVLYKYNFANKTAADCRLKLDETDEEFLHFKQRSMEREQQLNRKLLDEIKKHKKSK
ncbi:MAG TPA: hypothetical protein VFD80_03045 [Flavobacteriaceae bacterium]|nr:hypothetical protein [Flavobacteriaceae bacterium]